jgi:hypothetical protein
MSHEGAHVPTSVVLEELFRDPPPDYVMIAWLIGSLHKRSFGLVMLLIALVGLVPGMSVFIGILPRISSASNDFRARKPKPRAFHCPAPHAHAENRSLGASNHPIAKAPGDHHPSAVAHSVRSNQTRGRLIILLLAGTLILPFPSSHIIPALVIRGAPFGPRKR